MMVRRSRFRLVACLSAALFALTMLTTSLVSASVVSHRGHATSKASAQALMYSVPLTAAQKRALNAAFRAHPRLSQAQAAKVLATSAGSARRGAVPDGHGTSSGPCGTISLVGYSSGNYGYALFWNTANVGSPWFGTLTISTNGINASSDVYDIPPNSGSGFLDDVGDEPNATVANGWAVTTGGWYCGISVEAVW